MNKRVILIGSVVALLMVNMVLLVFVISTWHLPPKHLHHRGLNPKQYIIEQVHFNTEQISLFEKAIEKHRFLIDKKEQELRRQKELLYSMLLEENPSDKPKVLAEIAALHGQIEEIHYNHFLEIKSICREDQLNEFEELSKNLAGLFHPSPHPN